MEYGCRSREPDNQSRGLSVQSQRCKRAAGREWGGEGGPAANLCFANRLPSWYGGGRIEKMTRRHKKIASNKRFSLDVKTL